MVLRCGGARGARGNTDRLEMLLVEAAREFSTMPQAQMGLTAFCHGMYGAETMELLTQCGIIGPAQEHACAAEAEPSTTRSMHACAGEAAPSRANSGPAPVGEAAGGPIVAVKTEPRADAASTPEAASTPAAASAEPLGGICQRRTSTCFDFVCRARASRAQY